MKRLFALATAIPAFAIAASTSERVELSSNGQPLIGTLELPAGDPAPVVLLLHGFTGSRDELPIPNTKDGVFSRTARFLAENGFASLRIDFRGSGESTANMTYEKTTFDGQVADAMAAIDYLKASPRVKNDDVYVIGWSQGGLVASGVGGRGGKVDAIALWQAVGDPKKAYGGLLGAEVLSQGMAASADQAIKTKLPWGAEVSLNGAFFDGIESYDPMKEIAAFPGPVFVTKGLKDTTVLPAQSDAFIAAHNGPEELWTAEMDHVFNVFGETETLDKMVAATIAYFKANDD
jgi:hypothetical protein